MQTVFGEQNMREQLRPRAPACNWMRWRGRLRDRLAGSAGKLLTHVLNHFPSSRSELQRLGHVLADLAQPAVAAAWADRWRRIHDPLARQMLGKWTPRGLAPLERWYGHRLGRCF